MMCAQYEQDCGTCEHPIHIGAPIALTATHGYIHTHCAPGATNDPAHVP